LKFPDLKRKNPHEATKGKRGAKGSSWSPGCFGRMEGTLGERVSVQCAKIQLGGKRGERKGGSKNESLVPDGKKGDFRSSPGSIWLQRFGRGAKTCVYPTGKRWESLGSKEQKFACKREAYGPRKSRRRGVDRKKEQQEKGMGRKGRRNEGRKKDKGANVDLAGHFRGGREVGGGNLPFSVGKGKKRRKKDGLCRGWKKPKILTFWTGRREKKTKKVRGFEGGRADPRGRVRVGVCTHVKRGIHRKGRELLRGIKKKKS